MFNTLLKNKEEYSFMDIGPGIGWSFVSAKNILGNVRLFTLELSRAARDYYLKNLGKIAIANDFDEVKSKMDIINF